MALSDEHALESAAIQDRSRANCWQKRSERPIGKGAFGDVYLVHQRQRQQGQACVLKIIKLARQNEWQRQATHREIKLMAALKHPYVVPFVDSWLDNSHTVNVVLGYCEQGDLGAVLQKRQGKLFDESTVKSWLVQLLLALEYLESQGVLHRDIKTTNIFLHADGHVQLGDFGLSDVRDVNDAQSEHDQSLVGTPHFMSPELVSQKGYSYPTDVWSLGVCMYELMAQKPPFTAFNLNGLVEKIKRKGPAPLPAVFSPEFCTLITKCMLCKDPSKRATPSELLAMPCLLSAVAEERRKARLIMPDIILPPLSPTLEAAIAAQDAAAALQQAAAVSMLPTADASVPSAPSSTAAAAAAGPVPLQRTASRPAPFATPVPAVIAAMAQQEGDVAPMTPTAVPKVTPRQVGAGPSGPARAAPPASPKPGQPSLVKLLKVVPPAAVTSPSNKQPHMPSPGPSGTPRQTQSRIAAINGSNAAAAGTVAATAQVATRVPGTGTGAAAAAAPGRISATGTAAAAAAAQLAAKPAAAGAGAVKSLTQRVAASAANGVMAAAAAGAAAPTADDAVPTQPARATGRLAPFATCRPAMRVPATSTQASPSTAGVSAPAAAATVPLAATAPSPRMQAIQQQLASQAGDAVAVFAVGATEKSSSEPSPTGNVIPASQPAQSSERPAVAAKQQSAASPAEQQPMSVKPQAAIHIPDLAVQVNQIKSEDVVLQVDAMPAAEQPATISSTSTRPQRRRTSDVPLAQTAEEGNATGREADTRRTAVAPALSAPSLESTKQPGEEGSGAVSRQAGSRRGGDSPVSTGSSLRPAVAGKRRWTVTGVVGGLPAAIPPLPRAGRRATVPVQQQPGASGTALPAAATSARSSSSGGSQAASLPLAQAGSDGSNVEEASDSPPREVAPKRPALSSAGGQRAGDGLRASVPHASRLPPGGAGREQAAADTGTGTGRPFLRKKSTATVGSGPAMPWRATDASAQPVGKAQGSSGAASAELEQDGAAARTQTGSMHPGVADARAGAVASTLRRTRQALSARSGLNSKARQAALAENLRGAKKPLTYATQPPTDAGSNAAAELARQVPTSAGSTSGMPPPSSQPSAAASSGPGVLSWAGPAAPKGKDTAPTQPESWTLPLSTLASNGATSATSAQGQTTEAKITQDKDSSVLGAPPDNAAMGSRRTRATLDSIVSLPRISELDCLGSPAQQTMPGGGGDSTPTHQRLAASVGGRTPASEGGASSTPTLFMADGRPPSQAGIQDDGSYGPYMFANAMYSARRTVDTDLSSRGHSMAGISPMAMEPLLLDSARGDGAGQGEGGGPFLLPRVSSAPALEPEGGDVAGGVGLEAVVGIQQAKRVRDGPTATAVAGALRDGTKAAAPARRVMQSSFTIGGSLAGTGASTGAPTTPRLCRSAPGNAAAAAPAAAIGLPPLPAASAAATTGPLVPCAADMMPGSSFGGSSRKSSLHPSEAPSTSEKGNAGGESHNEGSSREAGVAAGSGLRFSVGGGPGDKQNALQQQLEELQGVLARAHGLFQAGRMVELGELLAGAQHHG